MSPDLLLRAQEAAPGGLAGFSAGVLEALGDPGVGALVLLETVFPPIPSEVILPAAGFLTQTGRLHLVPLILWATAGSVLGALALYALGRALGLERATALLARTRLISQPDLDRGVRWFQRRGAVAVVIGRLVPGMRSLVSIPAGASRMPLPVFIVCTALGSGIWNGALIGLGALLGTQRHLLDPVLDALDVAVLAGVVIGVTVLVVRRVRSRRSERA